MVILGLLVVLLALLLGAALIAGALSPDASREELDVTLFDTVTFSLSPLALIVAGMAAMFLLWIGLWMIKSALARKQRHRRDRKDHDRRVEAEREQERLAAQDREREYERQLDAERRPGDGVREGGVRDGGVRGGRDDRADVTDRDAAYRDDRSGGATTGTRDRVADRVDPRDRDVRADPAGETQRIDPRDARPGGPGASDTQRIDPRDGRR